MRGLAWLCFLELCLLPAHGLVSVREMPEAKVNNSERPMDSAPPVAAVTAEHALSYLRDSNGEIEEFPSCTLACRQCYQEHFQACLAYCQTGCQDYCDEKLSEDVCKEDEPPEVWVAKIGSLFDLMQNSGQLCQLKSPDGCPPRGGAVPTSLPPPGAPY
mmetsp:Transcript_13295/g.25024  ORF Transcript_13295/g.25024 Transcript_13295/m.25024 type:complete len:159 (+) Transcript_13295:124-600(+)